MQYEMVNENLKIAACSISSLTLEQAKHFLELWERGATLGTLTLFYTGDGVIVLNKDNKMYSDYLEMVENYLVKGMGLLLLWKGGAPQAGLPSGI